MNETVAAKEAWAGLAERMQAFNRVLTTKAAIAHARNAVDHSIAAESGNRRSTSGRMGWSEEKIGR